MTPKLSDTFSYWKMPVRGAHILCAYSGGADSTAMLHMLKGLEREYGLSLYALHINHMLRGDEAARDQLFCEKTCAALSVPFLAVSADIKRLASETNESIELAARAKRYELLESYAVRLGCNLIATAHTADDNAETILFNLIRGSGLGGLAGIPPVRGNIIRPLIEVTRTEVLRYLAENGLEYVTDSTNLSDDYTRNRIRHRILPEAYAINPDFAATLARNARLLRSQRDELALLEATAATQVTMDADGCHVAVDFISSLSPAIAGSVVLTMGEMCGVALENQHVGIVLQALHDPDGRKKYTLPDFFFAFCEGGRLTISKKLPAACPAFRQRTLFPGQCIALADGGEIRSYPIENTEIVHNSANNFSIDCGKINAKLVLRSRLPGDMFRKNARSGSKSLKKLMIDQKIPLERRDALVVVACGDRILAVEDIGVDHEMLATAGKPSLHIEIIRRSYYEK